MSRTLQIKRSIVMIVLMRIQDFREEAWIEKNETKTLPKELLKLRDITKRCTQHVKIYDREIYPKKIDKDLYTFGDGYDSVLRNANDIIQEYAEKSHSDETRDCICEIIATDPLPTEESNRKFIESAPQTEPICSKYASEERDLSISGFSGSTIEHPIAGPSSSADFSNTTGDNSFNPSDTVNNKFEKDIVPTGAIEQEDSYTQENFMRFLECLNTTSRGPVIESYNETNESDFILSSDETNSSDSESIDEDSPEYEKKFIINKMRDILKYGYKRIKNDMGKAYYCKIRPEKRNNDFRVYPEENTMLPKEKPTSDSQNLRQPKRKISAKSPSKLSNQKILIRNTPDKSLAKSSTSSGKQKGQFGNKRKKSISSTEPPVKKVRKISRNVSHVAKNKITKPTKAAELKLSRSQLFTKSKSSGLQNKIKQSKKKPVKDSFVQKSEAKMKNISLGSSKSEHIKKMKADSDYSCSILPRNISCSAKQKITKPTKVAQLKPPRSQTSAMKPCLRPRLNVSSELQNKGKSAKDSSIQKAEGKVKNISSQSSESKCSK